MKIDKIIGGQIESNGYIVYEKEGGEGFIIDPGYNAKKYIEKVREKALKIKGIILTHHHYDHIGAAINIKKELASPIMIHSADADHLPFHADIHLKDKDVLSLENESFEIVNTPGHTEGGICIISHKHKIIFTGDTIFDTDIGRTDFKDSDPWKMKDSIINVVNKWGNEYTIYPGHGGNASMRAVRKNNAEFIEGLK